MLLGGFRVLVDAATAELAAKGYEDVRPAHDFAMRAIDAGATNASELGRRMSITKQAATKVIETLLDRGYIGREPDSDDARRKLLSVTPLGRDVMREGERVFNQLRSRFQRQIGKAELAALEQHLAVLVGDAGVRLDAPGWVAAAV